ncbi:hypothetical protein RND71_043476 [Anisodus tanguticus]|uniref:Uncharacterized protein n=1 Tax=Anisodus tanguticus TaxID=243964 RepID=A0AAE1QP37_9SOLA|nr:hypothetical protein RND71_043476 [Anisodus tanguticus]
MDYEVSIASKEKDPFLRRLKMSKAGFWPLLLTNLSLVGVIIFELHCIHGYGVKTMETLHYAQNKFPDGTPEIQYGDGDGTVNLRSLDFCKNWINRSKKPVTYKTFDKTEHMQTTSSDEVVNYIGELVFGTKYETNQIFE